MSVQYIFSIAGVFAVAHTGENQHQRDIGFPFPLCRDNPIWDETTGQQKRKLYSSKQLMSQVTMFQINQNDLNGNTMQHWHVFHWHLIPRVRTTLHVRNAWLYWCNHAGALLWTEHICWRKLRLSRGCLHEQKGAAKFKANRTGILWDCRSGTIL